jgi:hypothetical protein
MLNSISKSGNRLLNEVVDKLWKALGRGYTSINSDSSPRNADDYIRASWARPIKSDDTIPDIFREFFESSISTGQDFPYTVLTPTYDGFLHKEVEKIICNIRHEIYVLEKNGNSFELQCYPLDQISYVQLRTNLMDSSFKIFGVTEDGVPCTSTLRYNSVTDYLFLPILQKIRHAAGDLYKSANRDELEKFDPWSEVNPKFMNFAKRSLLPGECVIRAVLSPEIRHKIIRIFGKTYDIVISPTLAAILTDQELIMIREEKNRRGPEKYGGIWEYISLQKIAGLSTLEAIDNIIMFSIRLTDGNQLEYLFQADVKQEIVNLQDSFKRPKSRTRSS